MAEFDIFFGHRQEPLAPWAQVFNEIKHEWNKVNGTAIAQVVGDRSACGEVDALYTEERGRAIAVVTADCVPVLLYRRSPDAVMAVHAGWRGVFAHILKRCFEQLPPHLKDCTAWTAVIGPSIRACCYEVSEELISDFRREFPQVASTVLEPEYRKLNLIEPIRAELNELGVKIQSIHEDCTFCSGRYFSYRKGDRGSRQYSMIRIS
jgi:YfiH family protein